MVFSLPQPAYFNQAKFRQVSDKNSRLKTILVSVIEILSYSALDWVLNNG